MQNETLFISYLLIQILVQVFSYKTIAKTPIFTIANILHSCNTPIGIIKALLSVELLITNIIITVLVAKITNASAMIGITNLGASVVLGIIMAIDTYTWLKRSKNQNKRIAEWIKTNLAC